ncbi:unnamed protein product, partial [Mesorhabditis spiculigera]
MLIRAALLLALALLAEADYDYTGRDYMKDKAERLIFGLWRVADGKIVHDMIDNALAAGYRTFDTAQGYGNEEYVGQAFKELLPKHNLTREDVFITTKVKETNQGPLAKGSIEESLKKLQVDYIDLMLIHWPGALPDDPKDPKHNATMRKQTWQTMEEFYGQGKLKAIGVSNFLQHHLEDLLSYAKAYACSTRTKDKGRVNPTYDEAKVEELAKKYEVSTKTLQFAWILNQGMSVLTRASSPDHIRANFGADNVTMSAEDVNSLKTKEVGTKICLNPAEVIY